MKREFFEESPTQRLKQLIKELSAEQIELKSQRKTGTYDTDLGYYKQPDNIRACFVAAEGVARNKPRITAALDLYHELRGSDFRHGGPDDYHWQSCYVKDLRVLREQFAPETVKQ